MEVKPHASEDQGCLCPGGPGFLDLQGTVDKTLALIEEAASQGARLIAFPETWIPGYPWFLWLQAPAHYMPLVQRYHQNSLVLTASRPDGSAQRRASTPSTWCWATASVITARSTSANG